MLTSGLGELKIQDMFEIDAQVEFLDCLDFDDSESNLLLISFT
jgi:aminoglycoside phosphotransferase family enzyme